MIENCDKCDICNKRDICTARIKLSRFSYCVLRKHNRHAFFRKRGERGGDIRLAGKFEAAQGIAGAELFGAVCGREESADGLIIANFPFSGLYKPVCFRYNSSEIGDRDE